MRERERKQSNAWAWAWAWARIGDTKLRASLPSCLAASLACCSRSVHGGGRDRESCTTHCADCDRWTPAATVSLSPAHCISRSRSTSNVDAGLGSTCVSALTNCPSSPHAFSPSGLGDDHESIVKRERGGGKGGGREK